MSYGSVLDNDRTILVHFHFDGSVAERFRSRIQIGVWLDPYCDNVTRHDPIHPWSWSCGWRYTNMYGAETLVDSPVENKLGGF